ncbi:hypothetical protein BU16DRAFT_565764 [Lophium mytilinum]|uniref:Ankyrin n=1 Tax=Lophium mytilinum TaxID=390894 RepID=A0A6A6QEK6_9PEZI|nr:hypothetical protein BU16DRAFT_565764 [Lophium mytilinum]
MSWGKLKTAMLLIDFGASVKNQEKIYMGRPMEGYDFTPLLEAVSKFRCGWKAAATLDDQQELIKRMLKLGASPDALVLDAAIFRAAGGNDGSTEIIKLLIEHGANVVDEKVLEGAVDAEGPVQGRPLGPRLDVLTKVALEKRMPELLAGEFILRNAEAALHNMRTMPRTRRDISGNFARKRRALQKTWPSLEAVMNTFKPGEIPIAEEIHLFWNKLHGEVEDLLRDRMVSMDNGRIVRTRIPLPASQKEE